MRQPESNGLFEVNGKDSEKGFFCMQLATYIGETAKAGTPQYEKLWSESFESARNGCCPYRNRCSIYKRTIKNKDHGKSNQVR